MNEEYYELTQDWFEQHGAVDPSNAWNEWTDWLNNSPNRKDKARIMYRRVLAIAAGVSASTVGHYINGRHYKIGPPTLEKLIEPINSNLEFPAPSRGLFRHMSGTDEIQS